MKFNRLFMVLSAFAAVLFFSCAGKKVQYYNLTLSVMVDEDPYSDGPRNFSLRDIYGGYSVEITDAGEEIVTGDFPLEMMGEESTDKYYINIAEGEYKLYEDGKDLNFFVTVGLDATSACYVECSSIEQAAKTLRNVNAPSGLGISVKEKTYQTLGYDNMLQRNLASCSSPVSMNLANCPNLSVGYRAFYGCSSLKSLVLSNSVTSLGKDSFYGCSTLRYISIPARTSTIDGGAFTGCTELTEIDISEKNLFYKANNGVVLSANGGTLVAWPAAAGDVFVPESVDTLMAYCFAGCKDLSSVNLVNVFEIQQYAFLNCSSLKTVNFPMTLIGIENGAFEGCVSLSNIKVDEGNGAYKADGGIILSADKKRLLSWPCAQGSIKIPEGITRVEDNAFQNQKGLKSVSLASSVKEIGHQAFSGCQDLVSVGMPSVVSIESYAFSKCPNLVSINIPASVRRCDGSSFAECTSLVNISIDPANTQYKAENGAIYSKDGKTLIEWPAASGSIVLNDSVDTIGTYAFNGCVNLKSVTMSSVVTVGHHAFDSCKALESVELGNVVETIGSHAFSNCLSIKTLYIPASVTCIKNYAFWFWGSDQTLQSQGRSKPSGWDFAWNADCEAKMVWGAKRPE